MTSGSAEPADDRPNSSSTTPTDGPPSGTRSTEELNLDMFPISAARLGDLLEEMFRYGWETARSLPGLEQPVPIKFVAAVDREQASVDVRAIVP